MAILEAVEAVASAVRSHAGVEPVRGIKAAAALEEVAATIRGHSAAALEPALAAVAEAMILPVDPSALGWNAFRSFEVEDSETAWTKWLAALLSPENGTVVSQLAWRSVCDAVVDQRGEPMLFDEQARGKLATLGVWRAARELELPRASVDREVADELGRPDIAIDAPGLFVVLENKLDAGWHDGDEPQATKYRRFGLKHRRGDQQLGLVLLTKRKDFELEAHCCDYVRILYRDLSRALRRNVRAVLVGDASVASLLAVWPVLITIAAIEQDLLGLDIQGVVATARSRSWRAVGALNEILSYLHEERQ